MSKIIHKAHMPSARQVALMTVIAGGGLVSAGVGLVYLPAGLVVVGVLLIVFGLLVVPVSGGGSR